MAQDVMAHFVAGHEDDLRRGGSGNGGVQDHDALGGAKAGDVSVDGSGFLAGVHPEHALGRNVDGSALGQFFEAGGERRIFLLERLEFVEERIDHEGLKKVNQQQNGQRNQPKVKPPAARGFADDGIEKPNQNDAEDNGDDLPFAPIPEPGAPTLHGKTVLPRNPVLVDARGQFEDIDGKDNQRRKDEGLERAFREFALGQSAVFAGDLPAQDEPENDQAVNEADQG